MRCGDMVLSSGNRVKKKRNCFRGSDETNKTDYYSLAVVKTQVRRRNGRMHRRGSYRNNRMRNRKSRVETTRTTLFGTNVRGFSAIKRH